MNTREPDPHVVTARSELRDGDRRSSAPRSRRRRAGLTAVVILTTLVALVYLAVPFTSPARIACGASGGVIAWEVGGAARQRSQAATDKARMQKGLDTLQNDPATASSPMGKELIEDAHDEMTTADAKLGAIDTCGTEAVSRIERAVFGVATLIAMAFGLVVLWSWLGRLRRRRAQRRRSPELAPVAAHCPQCGALLDDPLGCWSCGGFRDGESWRFPVQAPPHQARSITGGTSRPRRRQHL